jgi:branched-chain amino acid transport system ATP-binding protein
VVRLIISDPPFLSVESISLRFRGVVALDDVSLSVPQGVLYALVGPNGAGKTSLLNVVSGVFPQSAGRVSFRGNEISDVPLHRRVSIGIGRTFQGVELVPELTVLQNVMLGRHHLMRRGLFACGVFFGPGRREEVEHRLAAERAIEFFELERYRNVTAGTLPYGVQKIVGLARAICTEPQLLLLDEVASGLNRQEKENLSRFMLRMKHSRGITMIWVEHDIRMVSELADIISVLDHGRLIAQGAPDKVLADPKVVEAFVGRKAQQQLTDIHRATGS